MKPRDIDNASAGELEQIEEATGRMTREPLEKLWEAVYAAERRVSEYSDERQAELESAARATIRAKHAAPDRLTSKTSRKLGPAPG